MPLKHGMLMGCEWNDLLWMFVDQRMQYQAVQLTCGDRACSSCALLKLRHIITDVAFKKEMEKLQVTCVRKPKNCPWHGALKDYR
ncbi:unnamed protein product, partial [Didymodactylos carnosus]